MIIQAMARRVPDQFGDDQTDTPASRGVEHDFIRRNGQPNAPFNEGRPRQAGTQLPDMMTEVDEFLGDRYEKASMRLRHRLQTVHRTPQRRLGCHIPWRCGGRQDRYRFSIFVEHPVADLFSQMQSHRSARCK
ncbi:hypothetical protein NKH53_27040 [Mesorhizobium australicum]|uniref:hypothetical protein n=1 Tax=Mesorhizobium australicum TaxID=536018 RepID=UPI0033376A9D